ncbi:MAG: glycosyltransferase family 2 protein [Acidimicrobiales bacterium]
MAVCICTFGRTSRLTALLDLVAAQENLPPEIGQIGLVVVDNNTRPEASAPVHDWAHRAGVVVQYVHVPARGFAQARNAALARAAEVSELAALIDDDEVPSKGWLADLLACRGRTGAPIVIGPVVPEYSPKTPRWIQEGQFFYPPQRRADGDLLDEGITGNALLHLPDIVASGLRFDERFSKSGGEDQLFFREARAAGLEIRYCAGAIVTEAVALERARVVYLLKREFRKGNTLGLLAAQHPELGEARIRRLAAAAKWASSGALRMLIGPIANFAGSRGQPRARAEAVRGALELARAAGMVAGLAGWCYDFYALNSP